MTQEPSPRFDIDALRDLAGDKVFARGLAYHQAGQVTILAVEPARVVAPLTSVLLWQPGKRTNPYLVASRESE